MKHQQPPVIPLTKEYYQKIQAEKDRLDEYREEVLVRLQDAREKGDLSENGAYTAARFELNDTDRELRRIRYLLRFGKVVEKKPGNNTVSFASTVTIDMGGKQRQFTLVSEHESDPKEGKISATSPLGQSLIGHTVGDEVEFSAPSGTRTLSILQVE